MSDFICNSCGEYIEGDCICSKDLQSYDYDIYGGGYGEY